jgi:plasmid stabilization system protein ParE
MAQLTIRFANSARAEVNDMLGFIALDKPDAAAKFAVKIQKANDRLIEFPNSGRLIPEDPMQLNRSVNNGIHNPRRKCIDPAQCF